MRSRATALALSCVTLFGCITRVTAPSLEREQIQARREALAPEVMHAFRALKARLLRIETRIRIMNAPLCGPLVVPDLGILMADDDVFEQEDVQQLAARALGIQDRSTVVHVLPSGAFARAGGRVGDAVADPRVTSLTDLAREQIDDARSSGPLTVRLLRAGSPIELAIQPDVACAVRGIFSRNGSLLPWNHDLGLAAIPAGALRVLDDDHVAILIGHQLAHALIRMFPDRPDDIETLADRIGLFMVARAGFDFGAGPGMWARIAAEYPELVEGRPNQHGEIARRLPGIRSTVSEIRSLTAAGRPVHPGRF